MVRSMKSSISFAKGQAYVAEARLQTLTTKRSTKYRPILKISSPTKTFVTFGGSVDIIKGKKVSVDLSLDDVLSKTVKVAGN